MKQVVWVFFFSALAIASNSFASQLTVASDVDIEASSTDPVYRGEYLNNVDFGITSLTNNVGDYWKVSTDRDLVVRNDSGFATGAQIYGIHGQSNGRMHFYSNNGVKTVYAQDLKTPTTSTGVGIYTNNANAWLKFTGLNIEAGGNVYGVYTTAGKIDIDGTGLTHLHANQNARDNVASGGDVGGVGVFASGTSGAVHITNMDVQADENGNYGIRVASGGYVSITGNGANTLTASGNSTLLTNIDFDLYPASRLEGFGLHAQNASAKIEISGMNVTLNDNYGYGFFAKGTGGIQLNGLSAGQRNSLVMNGNGTSAGYIENALFSMTNMNASTDTNGVVIVNGGTLNFTNSSFETQKKLFDVQSGVFNATINGSSVSGQSALAVGATANIGLTNSVWKTLGGAVATKIDSIDSVIDMRAGTFNALTIGQYAATGNAVIYLNTYFDAAGLDTDKVTITQSSSGDTVLYVTSLGDDGERQISPNGILIVDQSAATSKAGNFSLYGGVVDSGAYEYNLFSDNDLNVYLKNTEVRTNTAKTIANVPATHIHIVKTGMNELQKRLGELRMSDSDKSNGLWSRAYAKHLEVDENVDSRMNLLGVEAGYDHNVYSDADQEIYVGLMAGYLYTDDIKIKNDRARDGVGHANTPSAGLYATWLNSDGWFADGVFRTFFSKMDMTTYTVQNVGIGMDADRHFNAVSLETGKQFSWGGCCRSYILEPKVEIGYIHAPGKTFTNSQNMNIQYGKTESFTTKFLVMGGYKCDLENGIVIEPGIQLGVVQEWDGRTKIRYAGSQYESDVSGTSFEMAAKWNAQINEKWSIYSDIAYEFGKVIRAISANVGIRITF